MSDRDSVDRLKSILESASSLESDARRELLERECRGDPALRARAEELLRLHDAASSFLGSGPAAEGALTSADIAGRVIGPYTLLEKIGEGGFGAVYLARQDHPIQRRVALKIVTGGAGAGQVVARFEAERQVLALMDHPNIAVVHDAGVTEEGAPYFVMEYVDGLPITAYADEHALSLDDRLALFRQLCEAVQHAHEKGVIHRDLKPSNVLVSRVGEKPLVKVIDFGIAKAVGARLEDDAFRTRTGVVVGTPEYMSPEQATGSALGVDTRSDVYSLGVILYELLAGALPFDRTEAKEAGLLGLLQIIREKEPPRFTARLASLGPAAANIASQRRTDRRSLEKRLRGDLQWITLKALEKDPARRYSSAAALAEDLGRHLANHPILARSPSTAYQIQKLVARHRGVAALAGVLLFALVGFGVAMSVLYNRQRIERLKAENINTFLQDMLASADPSRSRGDQVLARDILDQAAAKVSTELADEPELQSALLETLFQAYDGLGLPAEALSLAHSGVALSERPHGPSRLDRARALNNLGKAYNEAGHADSALVVLQAAAALFESRKRVDDPDNAHTQGLLAGTYHDLGRLPESESHARQAVELYRKSVGDRDPRYAGAVNTLSVTLEKEGRFAEAETAQREALAIRQAASGLDDPAVLVSMSNLAKLMKLQRKYAEAESLYRATITLERKVLGDDHPVLAKGLNNLAVLVKSLGRYDEAEPLYKECLDIQRRALGDDHPDVGATLSNLGALYVKQDRFDDAERLYNEALAIWVKSFGDEHGDVARAKHMISGVYFQRSKFAEAEALERQALATASKLNGPTHPDVVSYSQFLAQVLLRAGEPRKAREVIEPCLADQRAASGVDAVSLAWSRSLVGQSILLQGDSAAAETLLVESVEPLLADATFAKSRKRSALQGAIDVEKALGKREEAARLQARMEELLK